MRDPLISCANCGTLLDAPAEGNFGVTCPVCQFFNPITLPVANPQLTLAMLETQLGALVTQARESGIPLLSIVQLLHDELEFAAELAHSGRDLCVQIVDLGPRVSAPVRHANQDVSLLRGRVVGG